MSELKKDNMTSWKKSAIFAGIAALFIYFFYMTQSIYYADDLTFHLERSEYWYQLFSSGQFYSYGNFYSNSQMGIPLDAFYPFLTYIPLSIIRLLVSSPIDSWYLYWFINCWITLTICNYVGMHIWKSEGTAFIFSIFYCFSAYRILNLFMRGAVGEMLAMTFLPLVVLGMYKLIYQEEKAWIPLTLGMTFIAYGHILTVLILIPLLMIWCLLNYKVIFKKSSLIQIALASFLFIMLIAIVIFPLVEQFYDLGFISTMIKPNLNESARGLIDLIFLSLKNTINNSSLGTLVMGTLLSSAFFFRGFSKWIKQLFFYTWGIIVFMCFMNFDLLQSTFFAQVQYVWRLNIIITLFASLIFAEVVDGIVVNYQAKEKIIMITITVGILLIGFFSLYRIYNYFQINPSYHLVLTENNYYEYIGNGKVYDYLSSDTAYRYGEIIENKHILNSPGIIQSSYVVQGNKIKFSIESEGVGHVDTFIPYYPGLVIHSDGIPIEVIVGYRGTVQLYPTKEKQEFVISYIWTTWQIVGWVITWMTWLILIIVFSIKGYKFYK